MSYVTSVAMEKEFNILEERQGNVLDEMVQILYYLRKPLLISSS